MLSKGANRLAQRPSRLRSLSRIPTIFLRRYSRQPNILPLPSLSKAIKQQRHELLLKIYAPFLALDESSQEYRDIALSGKVWDNYFTFGDSERLGYDDLQYVEDLIVPMIFTSSAEHPLTTHIICLAAIQRPAQGD